MSRYIDADELWKEIESVEYYGCDAEVSRICGLIQNAPTAEVKPIEYGEWEHIVKGFMEFGEIRCSKCGWKNDFIKKFNFCPNCGANMKKEKVYIVAEEEE